MNLDFVSVVWPEDQLPQEAAAYQQCELCTGKSRLIWGEGNPNASIVLILDNLGAREDRDGQDYVCGTRQTLQESLHRAHVMPDDVYLTYLLKCRPMRKYNKEKVRAFSKPFLLRQLASINPKWIVCLGDVVTQTMFDDPHAHVKDLRGSWHTVSGFPCAVSYHPLAVRRRPNLMPYFMEDLCMLTQHE